MSKFLFVVWPFAGCLFPLMSTAQAVSRRGHEVAFYTGRVAKTHVESEAFRFFPFSSELEEVWQPLVMEPDGISNGWQKPWRLERPLREFFLGTVPYQVEDLAGIVEEWQPDIIVSDPAMWGAIVVLREVQRIPVVVMSPYAACLLRGPDAPPPGFGLPQPNRWHQRLLSQVAGFALDVFRIPTSRMVNKIRLQYGLPPLQWSVLDEMARLPAFLVPSSRCFDFERNDLPSSVQYVGACNWYPQGGASDWMNELPSEQPWVHASEGTINNQEPVILRGAAIGLANQTVQVILSTGHRDPDMLGLGHTAPNVHVKPWVSYPELLPRIDALVTIGGSGTVIAALAAGVPMVVVPMMWDQADNAQRIVQAGAGIRLSRRSCTPKGIRTAVEEILGDSSYKQHARELAKSLEQCGGPDKAAKLLEDCLSS
jgi:MGT family glycosyltransferase